MPQKIIRWIVGPKSNLEILKESVIKINKFYEGVDKFICYNQIDKNSDLFLELKSIKNVVLFEQKYFKKNYEPKNELWKLYPPRLNLNSYELVLDNDLVICDHIDFIEKFFKGNHTLLLQGHGRYFGKYEHLIDKKYKINGGLFGMPPNFDFENKIKDICNKDKNNYWEHRNDDQGIIAAALLSHDEFKIIPNSVILNYDERFFGAEPCRILTKNIKGIHFIGSNRKDHPGWTFYKASKKIKMI